MGKLGVCGLALAAFALASAQEAWTEEDLRVRLKKGFIPISSTLNPEFPELVSILKDPKGEHILTTTSLLTGRNETVQLAPGRKFFEVAFHPSKRYLYVLCQINFEHLIVRVDHQEQRTDRVVLKYQGNLKNLRVTADASGNAKIRIDRYLSSFKKYVTTEMDETGENQKDLASAEKTEDSPSDKGFLTRPQSLPQNLGQVAWAEVDGLAQLMRIGAEGKASPYLKTAGIPKDRRIASSTRGSLTIRDIITQRRGEQVITIHYINGDPQPRSGILEFHGTDRGIVQIEFPSTGNWNTVGKVEVKTQLGIGNSTFRFFGDHRTGWLPDFDSVMVADKIYEAEDPAFELGGWAKRAGCASCSGKGMVGFLGGPIGSE